MAGSSSSAKHILTGFLTGSVVTALVSLVLSRRNKRASNNNERKLPEKKHHVCHDMISIPPDMRSEQLSRNELFFGPEGLESIKKSCILIVGLGGVGSHAANMLARAGVGYLRIVDFDQVTLSSLNRHACATLEDVGIPKVHCLKRYLRKICGGYCVVDAWPQMYTGDPTKDGDMMVAPDGCKWDVIIDAIDDVPTKSKLLSYCAEQDIRVISCMGAGGKSDFTRLHISDLRSASRDPLASKLRQTIKRKLSSEEKGQGDVSFLENVNKLAVLYCSEKTVVKLADLTEEQKQDGVHNFGAVDNMRIRVIPVLGTMPAIMGQSLAGLALCEIGGKPFSPMSGERVGRNIRHRLFQHFKNRERIICDNLKKNQTKNEVHKFWIGQPQIDSDDVEYILNEVWRNRCCVTGEALGTVLEIARWDLTKPSNCQNLVLLGVKAMAAFDKASEETGDGRNSVPENIRRNIEARLLSCRIDSRA